MLQLELFSNPIKKSKKYDSINATLLEKAGFIDKTMAGVYTFLPLGTRVLQKIEQIIREEMDKIGTEIFMPAIVPKALWQQTKRLETVSILFKVVGANKNSLAQNNAEYVLSPTHEEVITPLAKKYHLSYKNFPFAVYQIQTKFRNEIRPKSGLLRCREFRMKDLYSFHVSKEDLMDYYEKVKKAYLKVFNRIGIGKDTVIALASGGDFTDGYSHEFQTKCETGEDTIFYAKKANIYYNKEITPSQAPPVSYKEDKEMPIKEVKGEGIIGVEILAKYLKIPIEKTTKTIIFETENSQVIAAAVRGGYDVSEEKLRKIVGCKKLTLASEDTVKKVTGAAIGYAGILNLPPSVKVYMDESIKGRKNFECGANRTNYHTLNVNFGRDLKEPKEFYDFKVAKPGDYYPQTGEKYEVFKACEVGNIFPLDTKFSKAFKYYYTDKVGKQKIVYMGSYGIGSSRLMGVIVEKFHDQKGILWPEAIAPFQVHLLALGKNKRILDYAYKIYQRLLTAGIEMLYDDREDISAGEKFTDADLIGIPWRVVISEKTKDKLEIKKREEKQIKLIKVDNFLKILKS